MKGIFFIPINNPKIPYNQVLDNVIKDTVFCDANNIDEAFYGEHMADKYEKVSSSLTLISSLSRVTQKINLGTMTANVIFHHPAVLSSLISTIDNLSSGRLLLGIGCGSNQCDLEITEKFGQKNYDLMMEIIKITKKILYSDKLLDIKSKNFNISSKKRGSKELLLGFFDGLYKKRKDLEIILPILSKNSHNIKVCSKNNWSFLSSNFCCEEILKSHISSYIENSKKNQKKIINKMKIARFLFVVEKEKEAQKFLLKDDSPFLYMIDVIKRKTKSFGKFDIFGLGLSDVKEIAKKLVIYGTPEIVSEKIYELKNNIGNFGSIVYTAIPRNKNKVYENSLNLFANEVKTSN